MALARCRSCGAPVLWVTWVKKGGGRGERVALQAEPSADGNVRVRRGLKNLGEFYAQVAEPGTDPEMYKVHFVDCPDSDSWRKG